VGASPCGHTYAHAQWRACPITYRLARHLTGKEYSILELLSLHKGRILTKEMFLNYVYDGMNEPEPSRSLTSLSQGAQEARSGHWRRAPHRDRMGAWLRAARSGSLKASRAEAEMRGRICHSRHQRHRIE
jgi:hypothetical protein